MSNYVDPISKQCTKKILQQIENSFYKIKKNEREFEFAYFSYIKYKNEKIPVLITKSDLIKEQDNKLELTINNETKIINIGDFRYKNKEFDVEIIKIEKNQNNIINFIEIDDLLYHKDYQLYYLNQSIYIIQLCNNDIFISYSIINHINKSEMIYNCQLNTNSKCSPIFNLSNNKLIGFNLNGINKSYNKKGSFLDLIINEFINEYKFNHKYNDYKNEIDLLIKVEKEDINEEIYFLDNKYYDIMEKKIYIYTII